MIGYLHGKVRRATADQLVVETGGVGYLVSVPANVRDAIGPVGSSAELHIHTHVREDQLALYGFRTPDELELFQMLILVDGVGPKVGLAIMSTATVVGLKQAILSEDVAPFRRASGVGPRTAQKVIIDLKPKLEADEANRTVPRATALSGDAQVPRQVEQALRGLGFSAVQARAGMDAVDWKSSPSPEAALATALKALGR